MSLAGPVPAVRPLPTRPSQQAPSPVRRARVSRTPVTARRTAPPLPDAARVLPQPRPVLRSAVFGVFLVLGVVAIAFASLTVGGTA